VAEAGRPRCGKACRLRRRAGQSARSTSCGRLARGPTRSGCSWRSAGGPELSASRSRLLACAARSRPTTSGRGRRRGRTRRHGRHEPPRDATPALIDEVVPHRPAADRARNWRTRARPSAAPCTRVSMLTARGPRVWSSTAVLGDPEAQAILPRLQGDPLPLLLASAQGGLAGSSSLDPRTRGRRDRGRGISGTPRGGDVVAAARVRQSDDLWILTRAPSEGRRCSPRRAPPHRVALAREPRGACARLRRRRPIRIEGAQMRRDIAAGRRR